MPERKRQIDQVRAPANAPPTIDQNAQKQDNMILDSTQVPFTDPTVQTVTKTFSVPSRTILQNQASTNAVTVDDSGATITAVTYTPAGAQAVPPAGNTRVYTVTGNEGTIASFTFQNSSSAFVNGTPISFTVNIASVKRAEQLKFSSTVSGGTGVVDPGGTLSVTYTV